ncbi:tryptophan synthase subunit alpha [Haloglomus litoreum]|uniref:tryptophan synthase subunit alpha n=1 Tax=Haloglomus litoreum TaxID=3034026 RepID=UPI003B210714
MSDEPMGGAGQSRIPEAFDGEPAFVPYLAAGDPNYEASLEYVEALARAGADCIELGLPFSEPIAEGPTIQQAVVRSLEGGMTVERYFEFVSDLDVDVPLVCMTYYNLIYRYGEAEGPEPFVERAAAEGIDGFVVPDLPAEEAGPLREACDEHGRDLVSIVAPTTGEERLQRLVDLASGYLYIQARLGVTGARQSVSDRTAESLARVAETGTDLPRAVGFGISSFEQARDVIAAGADGVIVGSALVDIVAEGHEADRPVAETADRLEELGRELKEGALAGAGTEASQAD